ncbi:hypothetical protein ACEWY4_012767 [Coilia grayii]|uniref:Uncharacterized protein n=1 Tax=Coilia grayii TaxID=363190 RepID=A0ABD1JUD6_9TELE
MKKGFLGRKNQSLFDTNVQMKDVEVDHLDLVLNAKAIPESGTAKVRSRPTVNYFNLHGSSDAMQGFAVPTPKVPVLPSLNGPKANGIGNPQQLHNGGMIAVTDDEEGEILIPAPPSVAPPPPPSMAPPPPPPQFIPPSPTFIPPPLSFGDVPPELASLQPPPMPAPKPPTLAQSQDIDLASLKPPPMPPPKPPSDTSSTNSVKASLPISTALNDPSDVPECPKFTPPPPPVVKQQPLGPQKTQKTPPPKPVRMSSIPNIDIASSSSTPAAVPSSFNPQNTAKVYSIPKTTLLSGGIDRDVRPKSILLLEDSSGVQVHGNGGGSTTASPAQTPLPPTKPFRMASSSIQLEKDLKDLKDNLTATLPGQTNAVSSSTPKTHTPPNPIPTPPKPAMTPPKSSPKLQKMPAAPVLQETSQVKVQEDSKENTSQYSPLLAHKLHKLKAHESPGTKESVTSPLALLMAAKERERQRSSLSRENSSKSSRSVELPAKATIQPSESKPNSFTVIPKSASSLSPTSQEKLPVQKPDLSAQLIQPGAAQPKAPGQATPSQERAPPAKEEPTLPVPPTATPSSPSSVKKKVLETQENTPAPAPPCLTDQDSEEDLCVPFIPPPPEFANSDPEEGEGPPNTPPPDPPSKVVLPPHPPSKVLAPPNPPSKVVPTPNPPSKVVPPPNPLSKVVPPPNPPSKVPVPPPPPPAKNAPVNLLPISKGPPTAQKPKPPVAPQLPPSQGEPKAKVAQQTKPKLPSNLPSTPASASQATLLSILQKKMLEMGPKLSVPVKEADSNTDEWATVLSEEEGGIPVPPKPSPKAKATTPPPPSGGLDMRELETRVAQKAAENVAAASKLPSSNGASKQPFGMTFTVRPGTKQPITLVSKGDS